MTTIIKIILAILFIYLLFKYGNIKNTSTLEKSILLLIFYEIFSGQVLYVKSPIILILLAFYILYRRYRNIKYTVDAYNDIDYLNRDIDTKYNPSIIGYLINMNLHSSDLIADIMNLYANKIIDIKKVNENNNIKYYLKLCENFNEKEQLCESDQYIVDTLIINKGKLFVSFDFKEWSTKVINHYRNTNLTGEKVLTFLLTTSLVVTIILALVLFILGCSIGNFFTGLIFSALIVCLYIACRLPLATFFFTVNDICLSKNGKEEFKKWIKFKKFMEEYTLIKDKKIDDIAIYEHYIPYSVALRIVDNYEDTMFKIFRDFEISRIKKATDI